VPEANISDFQAYTESESTKLRTDAQSASLLTPSESALDYGFVARVCTANCSGGGTPTFSRRIEATGSSILNVAFKIPRSFTPLPKPFRFKLSFLVTTDDAPRVTRAIGETTPEAEARAVTLANGGAKDVQVALPGTDTDALTDSRLILVRIANPRIGTAPTGLISTP
jgi:hypothetical protein